MVNFPRPNCQHLDNWRRCRVHVHLVPWWLRWLHPKGRPPCILDGAWFSLPQDGEVTCPDQRPWPRPAPPASHAPPPASNH